MLLRCVVVSREYQNIVKQRDPNTYETVNAPFTPDSHNPSLLSFVHVDDLYVVPGCNFFQLEFEL